VSRIFGGHRIRIVVHDAGEGRLFAWDAEPTSKDELPTLRLSEIDRNERDGYLLETPANEWVLFRRRSLPVAELCDLVWMQHSAVKRTSLALPRGSLASMVFRSIAASTLVLGEDWHVRIFIVDPEPANARVMIETLQTLAPRLVPAVYNAYLVGRLRARAGAIERGRVARELHDGVIQSLIGIEMRLDALRQDVIERGDRSAGELAALQQLLRGQVVSLRELMQRLSRFDVRSHQVVELLANVVDGFHRETGIAAQFTSEVDEVELSPRACHELVRMVQEALTNVRRHSGAEHALVHLASENGHFHLTVDDDSRGMPFAGRRDHQELEPDGRGPRLIKERVRSIGGALSIESRPGRGTRLEVVVPKSQVRPHA
jgi:signal transduction histidine kinase